VRVLHVVKSLGRGGAERIVLEIARRGQVHGDEHAVLVANAKPDDMFTDFRHAGVEVHELRWRRRVSMLRLPATVRKVATKGKFDIVHGHFPLTSSFERLGRVGATFAYVFTHHNIADRFAPITRGLNRLTWTLVDYGTSVSNDTHASVVRELGGDVPSTVVWNGVDSKWFTRVADRSTAKRRHGINERVLVVGVVVSMRRQKRLDRWVDAAAHFARQVTGAVFLVVGDGPEFASMVRAVREHGLDDRFVFAGAQEDPRPWYEAMDVFLMTSDYEGFGLVVVEAMAMGVVPVVTDVGPMDEIVGRHVGMVRPPDAKALADAIKWLHDHEAERLAMAERGVVEVRERFDVDRMVRGYRDVYEAVLRRR